MLGGYHDQICSIFYTLKCRVRDSQKRFLNIPILYTDYVKPKSKPWLTAANNQALCVIKCVTETISLHMSISSTIEQVDALLL